MNDLETLRPEVREALKSVEFACTVRYSGEDEYAIIRAELLRLATSNGMREAHEIALGSMAKELMQTKTELAALKNKIEKLPEWYNHPDSVAVSSSGILTGLHNKRIFLFMKDDVTSNQ